jgi:hypothetical protein
LVMLQPQVRIVGTYHLRLLTSTRYGQGREPYSGRHRRFCINTISHLHHFTTFFDGHWATHWTQVLDWVYDGGMGQRMYGTRGDKESRHPHRVAAVAGRLRSWFRAHIFREPPQIAVPGTAKLCSITCRPFIRSTHSV